jgi:two-component system chemotaxis response regulator CheY
MPSILLVEDHPDMRAMLQDLLEMGGYQVVTGRTGQEGLHVLEKADTLPVAVISDLNMPEMDGRVLCETIRMNPAWDGIRLILMSANPHDKRLINATQCGVDALIPKPFSLQELRDILKP